MSMLFTWSEFLTDQVKIRDAYQMLKKQGKKKRFTWGVRKLGWRKLFLWKTWASASLADVHIFLHFRRV